MGDGTLGDEVGKGFEEKGECCTVDGEGGGRGEFARVRRRFREDGREDVENENLSLQ